MANYITIKDLKDELGERELVKLADNVGDGNLESEHVKERINKAIGSACSNFDSFVRLRYTLPVPVTELVKSICIDLAVFQLYKSRATVVYEVID